MPVDPVTALHRYAVTLFDQGDGRAVDWPKMAEALFKVAFTCLDEAGTDDRASKVVRRVHGGAYNRLVGNADSGLPYTSTCRRVRRLVRLPIWPRTARMRRIGQGA